MTSKFKKFWFKIFIGRTIQSEKRPIISGTQRNPTNELAKFHLVKIHENVHEGLQVEVSTKNLKALQKSPTIRV